MSVRREYPEAPMVGAGGVVYDQDGNLLLVRRGREPMLGQWSIPGGRVRLGETLPEACRREVLEETGIEIRVKTLVELLDRIATDEEDGRVRYHYVIADFLGDVTGGELRAGGDASEATWASPRELESNQFLLDDVLLRVLAKSRAMVAR